MKCLEMRAKIKSVRKINLSAGDATWTEQLANTFCQFPGNTLYMEDLG